jgi:hypothetical protein
MKDVYAVLLQKEKDIARVRREIEALHLVASLISDDPPQTSFTTDLSPSGRSANKWPLTVQEAGQTGQRQAK